MELVQKSTQIRIGTFRERIYALPSAPVKLASRQLLTKHTISFIGKIITEVEPIAPKADLSALYMVLVANPTNYQQ
jgi:hypothetical protein